MTYSKSQRYLGIAFFLTLAFCFVEYAGGKLSGSLALIADAGHMLADVSALGIALFAGWVAKRKPTGKMTYGYYRIEVLAALVNGALLLTIAIGIFRESLARFSNPSPIETPLMIIVAAVGLSANIVSGFLLYRVKHESINVSGAFYHVLSDFLSSIGTLAAGILIAFTGLVWVDPVLSIGIAGLIGLSAWKLLANVAAVLMEATPSHIELEDLKNKMLATVGVEAVHDLHVWSIAPGKEALSAHVEVSENADHSRILKDINRMLKQEFRISHTTLQIDGASQRGECADNFHAQH